MGHPENRGTLIVGFLLLLLRQASAACGLGCLQCSRRNSCTFCDSSNGFYLGDGSCLKSADAACALLAQSGDCLQCAANTTLDRNANQCVPVPPSQLVPNCRLYTPDQICQACVANYYVANRVCVRVRFAIENCIRYFGEGSCALCAAGSIMAPDGSACSRTNSNTNCLVAQKVSCTSCKDGYLLNPNRYFTELVQPGNLAAFISFSETLTGNPFLSQSVCQPVSVLNCAKPTLTNTCVACNPGFYLSGGLCYPYPAEPVADCVGYADTATCRQCANAFFLTEGRCVPVTPTPNCLNYDGSARSSLCLACEDLFYSTGRSCVSRTISQSIPNCEVRNLTADACAVCAPGFVLTDDLMACLPIVAQCRTYAGSSANSLRVSCTSCNPGFALHVSPGLTQCLPGKISGCDSYEAQGTRCVLCANGFYLSNGTCTAHSEIPFCQNYSSNTANACTRCQSGYFSFRITTRCVQLPQISGCSSYSADGLTCLGCQNGFYQVLSGVCTSIPVGFANCQTFNGLTCSRCLSGFLLPPVGLTGPCLKPPDYLFGFCASNSTLPDTILPIWATDGFSTCSGCVNGAYPFTPLSTEAICVNADSISLYSNAVLVANCIRYGLDLAGTGSLVCMECASGFYISDYEANNQLSKTTKCTANCNFEAGAAVILDDLLGFVNICIRQGQTGLVGDPKCKFYARNSLQNSGAIGDFSCVLPNPASTLQFTPPAVGFAFENAPNTPNSALTASVDFLHGFGTQNLVAPFIFLAFRPSIFAFRAPLVVPVTLPTNPAASLANCDIIWSLGTILEGSAFVDNPAGVFQQATGNPVACLRCSFGYQMTFRATGSRTTNLPLPSCEAMPGTCANGIVWGGLPSFLNTVVSCHSCTLFPSHVLYPTIFMDIDGFTTVTAAAGQGNFIGFTTPYQTLSSVLPNHGFRCASPPSPIQTTNNAALAPTSLANCAVFGVLSVHRTAASQAAVISNFCMACGAGFYPVYFGVQGQALGFNTGIPGYAVTQCSQSLNCDISSSQRPFNMCPKCLGFDAVVPGVFYAYSDFSLVNCLPTSVPRCFILGGTLSLTAANACQVCQAGYFLNPDGVCETLTLPQSASQTSFSRPFLASKVALNGVFGIPSAANDLIWTRIHYLLGVFRANYGVDACRSGYIRAPAHPLAPRLCVDSSYLARTPYIQSSVFLSNCRFYSTKSPSSSFGGFLCSGCMPDFALLSDGSACVTAPPNCAVVQVGSDNQVCQTCVAGTINLAGVCIFSSITFCRDYDRDPTKFSSNPIRCLRCTSGYFLSTDQTNCQAGTVPNCDVHIIGSAIRCQTCLPGFSLMNFGLESSHCFPIPSSLNCAVFRNTSIASTLESGTLSCAACIPSPSVVFGLRYTSPSITNQIQTLCISLTKIANCASYDQDNPIASANSFNCVRCVSGFWLNAQKNICVPRRILPYLCTKYSETSDQCIACSSGSFLAAKGTRCNPNPTGISGCRVYADGQTCSQCRPGAYLSGNRCLEVTIPVSNCQTYSRNGECLVCAIGFFASEPTSCVKVIADNCLTVSSPSACATCPPNHGLQLIQGRTDCVAVNFQNCLQTTPAAPFKCLVCVQEFYVDDTGGCSRVPTPIPGCATYEGPSSCLACTSGMVLSASKSICHSLSAFLQFADPNCRTAVEASASSCLICAPGYQLLGSICVASASRTPGCWVSDPGNNGTCLLCRPLTFMNPLGQCHNSTVTGFANDVKPIPAGLNLPTFFLLSLLCTLLFH